MKYVLSSPSFKNREMIPAKYTCDGENISPELIWHNPPVGTHSFVLVMNDFELPKSKWNHWLIYNIPKDVVKLEEGIITLPKPAKLGSLT